MRVCLDARKLRDSGIGNYIRALLEGFEQIEAGSEWNLIVRSRDTQDAQKIWPKSKVSACNAPEYSLRELWQVASVANRLGADLFHAPHYVVPMGLRIPLVVTIHDLIHLKFPEYFSGIKRAYARWMLNRACRDARAILTISEQTKADLISMLGADERKIFVTYSGINQKYFEPVGEPGLEAFRLRRRLPQGFLLYVGNLKPHKNVIGLIKNWAGLPNSLRPPLAIVGAQIDQYAELQRLATNLGRTEEIIFAGSLPDEEMPALYQNARALILPSWYEGFGAPPLEAMASGIPVAVSNRGSLPEIAGGAALVFDPADDQHVVGSLERIVSDETLRQKLIVKGKQRASQFTWARCAEKTYQAYKQALEEARGSRG